MAESLSSALQRQLEAKREFDVREVEETIEAIRTGLVDAFVVESGSGHQVHALHPFESVEELHELMQAIRGGRVDALVVKTPSGDRVFVLQGADEPYRVLIETMQERRGHAWARTARFFMPMHASGRSLALGWKN